MQLPNYDASFVAASKIALTAAEAVDSIRHLTAPPTALVAAIDAADCTALQVKRMLDSIPALPVRHVAKLKAKPIPRHRWAADHGAGF